MHKISKLPKIKTIKENTDILTLAADGNWWGVKAKDKEIEEQLSELEENFIIENEWQSNEMHDLIFILGIDITDI